MRCQACNTDVPPGARFCQHCGARMEHSGATSSAPDSPLPAAPQPAAPLSGSALGARRRQDVPEEILWQGRYSPKAALGPLVGCALATLAILIVAAALGSVWKFALIVVAAIWLAMLGWIATKRQGIHYKLTNQMFYHQRGILTRTTNRIEVIDVDDITWSQGLLDRLVGVGRIEILSSDRTNPKFWIEGVDNVEEVAKTMDRARRAERIRRGVSVESLTPGVAAN